MKKLGRFTILLGLVITIVTGFNFVTRDRVIEIGQLSITRDRYFGLTTTPIIGLSLIMIGGIAFLYGTKRN